VRGLVALAASVAVAGAVTATGAAAAGTRPAAIIPTRGCTAAPSGQVCITISGSGLHVSWVRVSREKPSGRICDFNADVRIYNPTGAGVFAYQGARKQGCPPPYRYQFQDFNIDSDFADQSRICGRWFEAAQQQGGAPCETIHR
jgi:hypothetical protein